MHTHTNWTVINKSGYRREYGKILGSPNPTLIPKFPSLNVTTIFIPARFFQRLYINKDTCLCASFWHRWHTFLYTCRCALCTGRCHSPAAVCTGLACYGVLHLSGSFTYRCIFKWAGDSAAFSWRGFQCVVRGCGLCSGPGFSQTERAHCSAQVVSWCVPGTQPHFESTCGLNSAWQSHVDGDAGSRISHEVLQSHLPKGTFKKWVELRLSSKE